jgi:hypothetical protein
MTSNAVSTKSNAVLVFAATDPADAALPSWNASRYNSCSTVFVSSVLLAKASLPSTNAFSPCKVMPEIGASCCTRIFCPATVSSRASPLSNAAVSSWPPFFIIAAAVAITPRSAAEKPAVAIAQRPTATVASPIPKAPNATDATCRRISSRLRNVSVSFAPLLQPECQPRSIDASRLSPPSGPAGRPDQQV